MLYGSEGIVLRQSNLGEYDKIISVFTQDQGLVTAVVKGTRRPKSRLSPVTQPFTRAVFQLYKGRSLDRVTQVMLLTTHPGIASDYVKAVYASFLAELVMEIMPEREESPGQYAFLALVLSCLEKSKDPWAVAKWGELGLLARAGFAATFDVCQVCGKLPGASPRFSPGRGGAVCEACAETASEAASEDFSVSPGALRTLQLLSEAARGATAPMVTARGTVKEEVELVMRAFTRYMIGRRLKSSSLVENIEKDSG